MPSFVRVPPDSTGKKIGSVARSLVPFDNETNGGFAIGDVVTGVSSSATGTVTAINVTGFTPGTDGELYLKTVTGTFTNDENLQVSAVTKGVANVPLSTSQIDAEYQLMVLTDPDNPEFRQRLDADGAQKITFKDGTPLFSPFGDLLSAEQNTISDHSHTYTEHPEAWYDVTAGTGSITYLQNESSVLLDTGGTGSGASAVRQSHLYHPYQPGTGNLIEMTIVMGDVGKANVRRRWGYFDDDNGIFFELDGTTLYAVIRSSAADGSSAVDTRVAQADFSDNKLDGSSTRPFTWNPLNMNLMWFDYQWLGAGKVRMGMITEWGEKRVGHTFENANNLTQVYMRTGTLPIRLEVTNTGIASGNSQMRFACATVKALGNISRNTTRHTAVVAARKSIADTDGEKPIMSLRAATTYQGIRNSVISNLVGLSIGNNAAFQYVIRIRRDPSVLTGAVFAPHDTTNSAVEVDTTATAVSGGEIIWSRIGSASAVSDYNVLTDNGGIELFNIAQFILEGDNTTQQTLSISIQVIETGTGLFLYSVDWSEIQL